MNSNIEQKVRNHHQAHLLQFWDELPDEQRKTLIAQIEKVDFDLVASLVSGESTVTDWSDIASRSTSPPAIRLLGDNKFSASEARRVGAATLSSGQLAVILVAGGQGSRLGFPHPKGMYPLGPISQRTLYEIHIDRILAANRKYGVEIPLYLMTSPATHEETVGFLAANDNFGLPNVRVFCQGTMPAVDAATGKILLAEKGRLFESPDGHGGTLAALDKNGCLDDMKARGIDRLFYFQVDNPMVDIDDTEFIGYHILSKSEMTSQVVAKQDPAEKVGAVVSVDGTLRIIEYSDLPLEFAEARNDDGTLAIWAGSIAVHVFDVEFLERAKSAADALPFHRAHKKVPYVDDHGTLIHPEQPNAIKFERFIFDLLPLADNALVVEVNESEAFAPLKNAEGAPKDTAQTARAAMINQQRRWLEAAGVVVAEGVGVEINPRFAADAKEVAERFASGTKIDSDTYFPPKA